MATADLGAVQGQNAGTLLQDGRVLVVGGGQVTNSWAVTGSMLIGFPWFTMATLQDGTVLAGRWWVRRR